MSMHLILGSMFSGKSTELMRRVDRLKSIGTRCLVINHTNDTRVEEILLKHIMESGLKPKKQMTYY